MRSANMIELIDARAIIKRVDADVEGLLEYATPPELELSARDEAAIDRLLGLAQTDPTIPDEAPLEPSIEQDAGAVALDARPSGFRKAEVTSQGRRLATADHSRGLASRSNRGRDHLLRSFCRALVARHENHRVNIGRTFQKD